MANDEELDPTTKALIETASQQFDEDCQTKHDAGALEYGNNTWMSNDTFAMAMEELVDLANYARYTYCKMYLLRHAVSEKFQEEFGDSSTEIGASSFKPSMPKDWS